MNSRDRTTALVDGILRFIAVGGTITASLALPGLAIGLDKPLNKFLDKLDDRSRRREYHRVLGYMKEKRLIDYAGKYEHGITITKTGRDRLKRSNFRTLVIKKPPRWDRRWRLVIFDIPEDKKTGRNSLSFKLRQLGFQPLQRSVWVHPFPCHEEIQAISIHYNLEKYVSYIETSYIDNQEKLQARFRYLLTK